ncbi:MAG TPA: PIG-L family deacetylase [Terriglobales bacterium]|nr:PIG-L family deacetylase [Terriglobales bacterium]
MPRFLCVTAHPDDEVGGFGGSLRLYASRGTKVSVICLTAGTAASNRGGAKSDAELAAMRREEFRRACEMLNVTHGEVWDLPDGGLDRVNFYDTVERLTRRVRELKPHVMLTLGMEGAVTAHPDHSMAGLFATMAFHWAGRSNRFPGQLVNGLTPHRTQKLYYATANFTLPDRQPVAMPPTTTLIDIGDCLEIKIAAFRAHTSQNPLLPRFEQAMRERASKERFHLAASTEFRSIDRIERDLLEGVVE